MAGNKRNGRRILEGLQLCLAPARAGKMGNLDLGHDYMAGVRARARMLKKATRLDNNR